MPYLFQFLLFVLLYFVFYYDIVKKKGGYMTYFRLFYIMLATLVAFRYGVGIDTSNYMIAYDEIPSINELSSWDFIRFRFQPLYLILNSLCKYITSNFVIVQIFQALLFYHSLYMLLKKMDLRKFYILLVFYTYMYFSSGMAAMRESFAISFCLYALNYYLKNKWLNYYVFIFIGFLFHTGAIIFVLFPFYKLFKKRNIYNYLLFISCCLIAIPLFSIVQNLFGNLIADGSITRYTVKENTALNIINFIRNIMILWIIYLYCIKKKSVRHCYSMDIILLGTTYVIIDILGGSYLPILFRFSSHFFVFFSCCLRMIIDNINYKKKVFNCFILFFLFYQPLARGGMLFSSENIKYFYYSSVFSFDKSHNQKIINAAEAQDYILKK